MKFSQIIGRQELIAYFLKAHQAERLSHAYIVEGQTGSGKKTLVEAFVNYLLCDNLTDAEVCGNCQPCTQFQSGNHPDVIYVRTSKKTGYGVDDIRDYILSQVNIRPYQSKYKIYIMEAADSMTIQAQNVLLKTIEEPPAYALFFLLAENKTRLLETVLSRCVHLKMPLLTESEMQAFLRQTGREDKQDLIPFAEGNIGKFLQLSESETFAEMKRDLENLLDRFIKSEERVIIGEVKKLEKYEENLEEALNVLQIVLRERLRSIYQQKKLAEQMQPAGKIEYQYYGLSLNLIRAKKQLLSNVNKNMILWNLFLP